MHRFTGMAVLLVLGALASSAFGQLTTTNFYVTKDDFVTSYTGGGLPFTDCEQFINCGAGDHGRFAMNGGQQWADAYIFDFNHAAVASWIAANPLPAGQYYKAAFNLTPYSYDATNPPSAVQLWTVNLKKDWAEGNGPAQGGCDGTTQSFNWTAGTAAAAYYYAQTYYTQVGTNGPKTLDTVNSVGWVQENGLVTDQQPLSTQREYWRGTGLSIFRNSATLSYDATMVGTNVAVNLDPSCLTDIVNNPYDRGLRFKGNSGCNAMLYSREAGANQRPYLTLTATTLVTRTAMSGDIPNFNDPSNWVGGSFAPGAEDAAQLTNNTGIPVNIHNTDVGYVQDLLVNGSSEYTWGSGTLYIGRQMVYDNTDPAGSAFNNGIQLPGTLIVKSGKLSLDHTLLYVGAADVQSGQLWYTNCGDNLDGTSQQLWMLRSLHLGLTGTAYMQRGNVNLSADLSGRGTVVVGAADVEGSGGLNLWGSTITPGDVGAMAPLTVAGHLALLSTGGKNCRLNVTITSTSQYGGLKATGSMASGLDQTDLVLTLPLPGVNFKPGAINVPVVDSPGMAATSFASVALTGTAFTNAHWHVSGTNLVQAGPGSGQMQLTLTSANWNGVPGDADLDDHVALSDLDILAANWNSTTAANWGVADFDFDGNVALSDLDLLAANWNYGSAGASPVPEPASLTLLAVGALGLLRRRRQS